MLTSASTCRLYLQTKLANPHYPPEIAAQTTLVNFGVTEIGLEEQLLALVVRVLRLSVSGAWFGSSLSGVTSQVLCQVYVMRML